jgi:hypothetical protein
VRGYLLQQLNSALRRPGMYGGESAILLLLDAIAFTDGAERPLAGARAALKSRGAALPTGVTGAVGRVLGYRAEDVMASVYAEPLLVAGRLGGSTFADGFVVTPAGATRRARLTA